MKAMKIIFFHERKKKYFTDQPALLLQTCKGKQKIYSGWPKHVY